MARGKRASERESEQHLNWRHRLDFGMCCECVCASVNTQANVNAGCECVCVSECGCLIK